MSHVRNIHYSFNIVTAVTEIFFKHILHNITAEISYMGKVVNRGTAGVHINLARNIFLEIFLFMRKRVVKLHIITLFGKIDQFY